MACWLILLKLAKAQRDMREALSRTADPASLAAYDCALKHLKQVVDEATLVAARCCTEQAFHVKR